MTQEREFDAERDESLNEEMSEGETLSENSETESTKGGRGFASMSEEERRRIASKGGKSQGKDSNPGNFANDPVRAREAGRRGGRA